MDKLDLCLIPSIYLFRTTLIILSAFTFTVLTPSIIGRELKKNNLDDNLWHAFDTICVLRYIQYDTFQSDPNSPQHDASATSTLRHTFLTEWLL